MKIETPEKGFVCSVVLKQNWKLRTKFTVSLKNRTPQIQRQHLEKADSLVEKVKEFKDQFSKIAFTQMSIENIMILLAARFQSTPSKFYDFAKFYDLEFLPCDLSVYNHIMIERPLDIAIHWRRPEEIFQNLNIMNDPNTLVHANPQRVKEDLAKINIRE